MSRRYGWLAITLVVAALLLSLAARRSGRAPAEGTAAAPVPETALTIVYHDRRLDPEHASVAKGHRVRLTVVNADRAALSLVLGGYQDRVHFELAPGDTGRGTFVADLPGDDFAWLEGGRPVGVLRVTGSHLEDGHR